MGRLKAGVLVKNDGNATQPVTWLNVAEVDRSISRKRLYRKQVALLRNGE